MFFCWATIRRARCNTLRALRTIADIWSLESVNARSYAIHALSISKSYEFVIIDISTPWAWHAFSTDARQRSVAVSYKSSPRWLLILLVSTVFMPKNDVKSKPVLSNENSNSPDTNDNPPDDDDDDDDARPDITSTNASPMLLISLFNWVLSFVDCMAISASVWVNKVSTWSAVRPIY